MNNAANALAQPHGEYTPEAWAKSLDVNLRGPVFLVQEALPHLKKSGHAAVLNVLSGAAFLFSATISLYAIGKAGLAAATRSMAAELAPHGIRVNSLSPGTIDTDMVRKNPPEAQAEMTKHAAAPAHGPPRRDGRAGAAAHERRGQLHHGQRAVRRRRHGAALQCRPIRRSRSRSAS